MRLGCCNIVLLLLGILGGALVIVGAVLGFEVFPSLVDDEIIESVRLKSGTDQFDRWETTPMPFAFKVYIFNVENVDDIMTGAKPIVKEVGPYIYRQNRKKIDVSYSEESDTLEYSQKLSFAFDAAASAPLTENDEVTVLNVALQGVMQLTEGTFSKTISSVWQRMFQDSTTIFHKIKVRDLLFDGYRFCDPATLQGALYAVPRQACDRVRKESLSETLVVDSDNTIVFSFFKHKITNDDGPYVIKAGNIDVNELGAILSWKGAQYIDSWVGGEESQCNRVRGRDSSIYPPFNNDSSSFDIFNSDICRIVKLRTQYSSSHQGIDGYVAKLSLDALSNGDDECYCTTATKNLQGENDCFPDGFGDLRTCTQAPVIASFPHFLWADPQYRSTVEGLTPDEEKHATFVLIEPGTGSPLQGAKRMQFNMVIRPIPDIVALEQITPAVMPILWVEESVELTDELVQQLKDDYLDVVKVLNAVSYTMIGVGAFLLIAAFGGFFFRIC